MNLYPTPAERLVWQVRLWWRRNGVTIILLALILAIYCVASGMDMHDAMLAELETGR